MEIRDPTEAYIEFDDPESGERVAVSVSVLFSRIWDEYIRGMMDNAYCRGLLTEMTLTPCEGSFNGNDFNSLRGLSHDGKATRR
jgi:hypothetical protein